MKSFSYFPHFRAWIFAAAYYWLDWVFLAVTAIGLLVHIYLGCRGRRRRQEDQEELLDDENGGNSSNPFGGHEESAGGASAPPPPY